MTGTDELVFSEDELYEAIRQALEQVEPEDGDPDPGTITSTEVAKNFGVSRTHARKILVAMEGAGILKKDWVLRHDDWSGKSARRKGYRYLRQQSPD